MWDRYDIIDRMCQLAEEMTDKFDIIGISCGGPLDSNVIFMIVETYKIHELHLPVYHYLCVAVEEYFFV